MLMTPEFAKALVAAQKATNPVYKEATNPAFRSKYADLAAVVDGDDDGAHLCRRIF
jgi:hypothetical protein